MIQSEKQFNTKATTESFDEIYTNYDVSVEEDYLASTGYPFDYPTKWLNDPSMNKRIAIRRLDVLPSSHSFTLTVECADVNDVDEEGNPLGRYVNTDTIDVSYQDNLIEVLNHICNTFSYEARGKKCGLKYEYDVKTNELIFSFENSKEELCNFIIAGADTELIDFNKFLNQPITTQSRDALTTNNNMKTFQEVWSRDRLYFHASFSTSRRKFIGKQGDFYQNLTLLYPSPTNESTFYIRFSSNGVQTILIRHCEFDIQLCFIVNYKKSAIL